MSHSFYITPTEYQQANLNGISAENLDRRVRLYGWKKERAMTEPPRQRRDLKEWAEIAKRNGIAYKTFQRRMERHWDPERASTQPLTDKKELMLKNGANNRIYPNEFVDRALANGILYKTFTRRMRDGWTLEQASAVKTMSHNESGRSGKEVSSWGKSPMVARKRQ